MTGWRLVRPHTDPAPASVRRFALRARQRRLRAARPWLAALGAATGVAVLVGLVGFTGVLGVRRITVTGATLVTPDQVRAAAAIPMGTPMVRADTGAAARRVRRLAPVRTATVVRHWPATLEVRVVERTAVAAVPAGDGFTMVDAAGVPFRQAPQRPDGLPLVKVASPAAGDATTRAALTVLLSLPAELTGQLAALVAEAPARIRLELADGRTVIWGDATENEAKVRVALVLLGRPGTVLDVSAPTLVTVR